MNTITLKYTDIGPSIYAIAADTIRNAKGPTCVVMEFVGGAIRREYTEDVAELGPVNDALEYFENLLDGFDRYYAYSDDHSVYLAGRAAEDRLNRVRSVLESRGIDTNNLWDRYINTEVW